MIKDEQAIAVARRHALEQGWPWATESVTAVLNHDVWYVATHVDDYWVDNVYVDVDAISGIVVCASFRPAVINPIEREIAIEIGRAICKQNGWSWNEVLIEEDEFEAEDGHRINCWTILTYSDRLGGNATIMLDAQTGKVLETMFASR